VNCTGVQHGYSTLNEIYHYDDTADIFTADSSYTILNGSNQDAGSGNLASGTYQIVLSGLAQVLNPPNYILMYKKWNFNCRKWTCSICYPKCG